jgi:hypothetical protein
VFCTFLRIGQQFLGKLLILLLVFWRRDTPSLPSSITPFIIVIMYLEFLIEVRHPPGKYVTPIQIADTRHRTEFVDDGGALCRFGRHAMSDDRMTPRSLGADHKL